MKDIVTISIILTLIGCKANNSNEKENIALTQSAIKSKEIAIENDYDKINYNNLEEFVSEDGLYKFKAPEGLFKRSSEDEFTSEILQAKIRFTKFQTYQFDEKGIFSKNDLIRKFKKKIKTSYFLDKNDWFILSGTDKKSNIIYLKGYYEELVSMQGRDEGAPSWVWSKSGILEINYTEKNKKEFDNLIPIIFNSFKCDFSVI